MQRDTLSRSVCQLHKVNKFGTTIIHLSTTAVVVRSIVKGPLGQFPSLPTPPICLSAQGRPQHFSPDQSCERKEQCNRGFYGSLFPIDSLWIRSLCKISSEAFTEEDLERYYRRLRASLLLCMKYRVHFHSAAPLQRGFRGMHNLQKPLLCLSSPNATT